jgi:hypothetical protein
MPSPARRRFDHLAAELSLALGVRVPRHALWLASARHLESAARAADFCGAPLDEFLCEAALPALRGPSRERLRRAIARFDGGRPTAAEIVAVLFAAEGRG